MNDDVAAALLAVSGAATPSMAPRPNRSGVFETRFSTAYAASDDHHRATAGEHAEEEADHRAAADRAGGLPEVLARGPDVGDRGGHVRLPVARLEVIEDLADAEQTHRDDDEVEAVGELQAVEGEARCIGERVATDGGEQQPDRGGDHGLDRVAAADGGDEQDAEQGEGGVLGWPEVEGPARHQRSGEAEHDDRDRGPDERADGGDTERGAGLPLLGQREAVEDRDDRRRLAGKPEQDGRDRAAVLGAVVDAGQHDDRRNRVDGVHDGQQDRHRRRGAEPRQHADQHADEHADQAVEQVLRLGDDAEAVEECVDSMAASSEEMRQRDAQPVEEQDVERGDGARR